MAILSDAGTIGVPTGEKEAGQRVDFKPDKFDLLVETKGARVAWSRAAFCPCDAANDQTEQADPTCAICSGSGWFLFKPAGAVSDPKITGELDALQTQIVGTDSAIIKCLMLGSTANANPYDQVLRKIEGTVNITARPENQLGYHDRLVELDAYMPYSQLHETAGEALTTATYPVAKMNLLRSESTIYVEGTDFTLVTGGISWTSAPASGTRLSLHYLIHPVWRIVDYPHSSRLTSRRFKAVTESHIPLAVQGTAKLEWLVGPRSG